MDEIIIKEIIGNNQKLQQIEKISSKANSS